MMAAARFASPSSNPVTKPRAFVEQAVGLHREAEQLGQLTDDDREGEAVQVADLRRLGQQVRHEAEPREARHDHQDARP